MAGNGPSRFMAEAARFEWMSIDAATAGTIVRALVEENRDQCLWFLRPDYYPAGREEILRTLAYIERYGNLSAYRRAAEVRQWLSLPSNAVSASS
jgi:hypothetical protein